jgi:hypothetical protein
MHLMNHLKLYRVENDDNDTPVFVTARSTDHAAQIYVTIEVAEGRPSPSFSVARADKTLSEEQQIGLNDMFAHEVTGIAVLDPLFGWCVSIPV